MTTYEVPDINRFDPLSVELLQQLRSGSPAAHAALYRHFAPALHRFAVTRLGGDELAAEEVVVQTFVDAARNLRQFNHHKATLSAWLHGIARRHIYAELRKLNRQMQIPTTAQVSVEAVPEVPDSRDLAAEVASRLDAQRQFVLLAGALSQVELDLLILQYVDQLSLKEIGQVIGRSERAVHSLLHRARQKARERLAQDE